MTIPDYRIIDSVRYPSAMEHVFFIEDLDQGGPTITNKAELVYILVFRETEKLRHPDDQFRLVYKDTMGEWAEITSTIPTFAPWHGETPDA